MNDSTRQILRQRRMNALHRAAMDEARAMEIEEYRVVALRLRAVEFEIAMHDAKLFDEEQALKQKLNDLQNKYNVHPQPVFTCPHCQDLGYIDDQPCDCVKQIAADALRKRLSIGPYEILDPAQTDFSIFGDYADQAKTIYQRLGRFCDKFDTTQINNIVVSGPVGCGKSYLASYILNKLNAKNVNTLFLSAFEFGDVCLKYHTAQDNQDTFKTILDADFLVLDDLGTEPIFRNVTIEYLYSVMSARTANNKKTFVTTNLDLEELLQRYGERIFSRMTDKKNSVTYSMRGNDLRRKGV